MEDRNLGLEPWLIGGGNLEKAAQGHLRLHIPPKPHGYADAQLDDYHKLRRKHFPWRPPVQFNLLARASTPEPLGTLGFGFWNDPFTLSLGQGGAARRLPTMPRAVWFFYGSPPNDLSLTTGLPGHGWKASCLNTPSIPAVLVAPLAASGALVAQLPGIRKAFMRFALKTVTASESLLTVSLDEWHHYQIRWDIDAATFTVDGVEVLCASQPPGGPLGFVAWIDNQYAVASPEGGFRFGVISTAEAQWLDLADLQLAQG